MRVGVVMVARRRRGAATTFVGRHRGHRRRRFDRRSTRRTDGRQCLLRPPPDFLRLTPNTARRVSCGRPDAQQGLHQGLTGVGLPRGLAQSPKPPPADATVVGPPGLAPRWLAANAVPLSIIAPSSAYVLCAAKSIPSEQTGSSAAHTLMVFAWYRGPMATGGWPRKFMARAFGAPKR